jgi:hypothetical protein
LANAPCGIFFAVQNEDSNWELAFDHYQNDRVLEAYDLISQFGVGKTGEYLRHFRMIEAEAVTRQKAIVQPVTTWLTIEYVAKEVAGFRPMLPSAILDACEGIANRLDWKHGADTRLTILAEETDADWAAFPQGYCAGKEPYEKICLPNHLLDNQQEFHAAVAHEYAHVISGALSGDEAPRWLDEAISVLAEGSIDEAIHLQFQSDPSLWLSAADLESVYDSRSPNGEDVERVLRAYQQSGWIGRYLSSLGPETLLRDLLQEQANEGVLRNLRIRAMGLDRVDLAIRTVYGMTTSQLFSRALRFATSQHAMNID